MIAASYPSEVEGVHSGTAVRSKVGGRRLRIKHSSPRQSPTGVLRTSVANVYRSLLNLMTTKSRGSARVDRMSVIQTVASGVSFNKLDTHERNR